MASLPHSLQCVDCTTQLGVVVKLAEGTLNPIVLVDKDVKITQYSCQHSKQYGLKKVSINFSIVFLICLSMT